MSPVQFLFMGTGTSTGLPLAPCLTNAFPYPKPFAAALPLPPPPANGAPPPKGQYDPAGPWPRDVTCACCRSTVDPEVPEGWKNRRGNTGGVLRKKDARGQWKNVLLDVGKTFREQAIRFFPRWGVHSIDAVVLTHGHADAYFGLDDLREWCIRQGTTIPVYLDRPTYEAVAKSFPYLVDRSQASGGGDIPSLAWEIVDDYAEFDVCGINVKTLPVEHGIYFRVPPPSSEDSSGASTPIDLKPEPLICLGFLFDDSIAYLSDVSVVPERTWDVLLRRTPLPNDPLQVAEMQVGHAGHAEPQTVLSALTGLRDRLAASKTLIPPTPQGTPGSSSPTSAAASVNKLSLSDEPDNSEPATPSTTTSGPAPPPLPILIVDSLWPIRTHVSHTNFAQALEIALRLNPSVTYLTGMTHPSTHFMWEELCLAIRGKDAQRDHPDAEQSKYLVKKVFADGQFSGASHLGKRVKDWGGVVEPAWDGLVLEAGNGEGLWKEVKGPGGSINCFGI